MSKLPLPVNAEERYLYDLCEKMELMVLMLSDIRDRQPGQNVKMTEEEFYSHIEEEERKELPYNDMTKNELVEVLNKRDVDFNKRQKKEELVQLAYDTE